MLRSAPHLLLGLLVGATGCGAANAAAEAPATVQGSWIISPMTPGPPFQAMAAFGAGGVFITTGSDQAGTGIGQWVGDAGHFGFSYLNYHFGPDGALTGVTTVNAAGTFAGTMLEGTATQSVAGPDGALVMPARQSTFTGQRLTVTAP